MVCVMFYEDFLVTDTVGNFIFENLLKHKLSPKFCILRTGVKLPEILEDFCKPSESDFSSLRSSRLLEISRRRDTRIWLCCFTKFLCFLGISAYMFPPSLSEHSSWSQLPSCRKYWADFLLLTTDFWIIVISSTLIFLSINYTFFGWKTLTLIGGWISCSFADVRCEDQKFLLMLYRVTLLPTRIGKIFFFCSVVDAPRTYVLLLRLVRTVGLALGAGTYN